MMKTNKLSLLATCFGVCCFFNAAQGMDDKPKGDDFVISSPMSAEASEAVYDPKTAAQFLQDSDRLPTADARDFAEFSYCVNRTEWNQQEKGVYNKLINAGWELHPFNKTADAANHESVSGFIAFKGRHVVISTRGTEMANWNDWLTNLEFSRSPIGRMYSSGEANKANATEQVWGELTEEEFKRGIHPGFLQTHLSSWDTIRVTILKRAETLGVLPQDLRYTVTGHSLGGAKAQLNAVWLAKMLGPKSKGNIEVIVFGSPRVFDKEAAVQVEKILGEDMYRIETFDQSLFAAGNPNPLAGDTVTFLAPAWFGFEHVGQRIGDNQGISAGRHTMDNIGSNAMQRADALRMAKLVAR